MSLLDVGLPKWPQMYVTGVPVTVEQAKEIIRRTDTFFTQGFSGNNREFNKVVRKLVGMPPSYDERPYEKHPPEDAPQQEKDAFLQRRRKEADEDREMYQDFMKRWQLVKTEYVRNSWVSCSFIGGPHGWCHPDGNIGFVDNIGKWPSVRSVFDDWQKLAEAFPFIDVGATLFTGEDDSEEKHPAVSFRVRNGLVELMYPHIDDVHKGHPKAERRSNSLGSAIDEFSANYNNPYRELGISEEWIYEWAAKFGPRSA